MIDDIKKTLWATADKLRANMDAAEYKHVVLGLIFLKYISDAFAARRTELTRRFADPADAYHLGEARRRADRRRARRPRLLQGRQRLLGARGRPLGGAARRRQAADIGKRIDDAMTAIETENPKLKGILHKRFARAQLPDGGSASWSTWSPPSASAQTPPRPATCSGEVYEYFLGKFASAEGKRGGAVLHAAQRRQVPGRDDRANRAASTTRAAVRAGCSCRVRSSSKPTAADSATCRSTGRRATPPPGAARQ